MTTYFENQRPPEYLHYWMTDAPPLQINFAQTKADILNKHMQTMNTRIKNEATKLSSATNISQEQAELFLSGQLFDEIMSEDVKQEAASLKQKYANEIGAFADVSSEAAALIKAGTEGLDNLGNFVELLQDWFNTLDADKQAIANSYSDWLATQIMSNRLGKNEYTAKYGKGQAAQKIIASILANTHDSVFTTSANKVNNGEYKALSTTEKKMVAILNYALDAANGGTGYTVRHRHASDGVQSTSTQAEMTAALAAKVQKGIEAQHRASFEISNTMCQMEAALKSLDIIKNFNASIKAEQIGSKYVSPKCTFDPEIEKMLTDIKGSEKSALSILYGKQKGKADTGYTFSWGGNSGVFMSYFAVSSKTSEWSWKKNIDSVDIKAQDGTSLFVLLAREAKMSHEQLYDIYQLAGGVAGIKRYDKNLDLMWNQLLDIAKYEAVLDCIAGIPTSNAANGQVFFVNINDSFFTVSDILNNIKNCGDVSLLYGSDDKTNSSGLMRKSYTDLNYFESQALHETRIKAAEARSARAMKDIPNLMYQTKIRVNITLKEMIAFSKASGFLKS